LVVELLDLRGDDLELLEHGLEGGFELVWHDVISQVLTVNENRMMGVAGWGVHRDLVYGEQTGQKLPLHALQSKRAYAFSSATRIVVYCTGEMSAVRSTT
jgi:hypothetical protein